ncbi:MAG: tRNA threonylcarbamoyladenosine dehydratase [Clostridium sp.]|nr:tRNA threonylcarbamoyladenosine dehydratase [Clostridium sp.]
MESRTELLFGAEAIESLKRGRVILFGCGGVGSWCAEALARTGVGHITLVDFDRVEASNMNRQLAATKQTLGQSKVEALAERLRTVCDGEILALERRYTAETAGEFGLEGYDAVIDAIDSVGDKAALILHATSIKGLRLFSSMGAARRVDPSMVEEAEFWKVRGCPLARALRERFKKEGVFPKRKFRCVYSEEPIKGEPKGSCMAVTATFGMRLAALAIDALQRGGRP